MSYILTKATSDTLLLGLTGRIDSTNATDVENEITAARLEHPGKKIILDADALEYISSAGLRIVLRLRKTNPDLSVINANQDVYEIFDVTGFTDMVKIEKAYRKVSVDGCEVIGQGSNGMVYRIDPETIVKVYKNPDSLAEIQNERDLARSAFVKGINTAIPYDIVKVGNSYGSVFELLNAKSISKLLAANPEQLEDYLSLFVDLLKQIHATEVAPGEMPDEKEVVLGWVAFLKDYLPKETWEKLHKLVMDVPDDHHMMHGDYHTKNVMVQNGETLLIDMDTLSMGAPIFEFASIFNAFQGFAALDHNVTENFLGIPFDIATTMWKRTLEEYFGTTDWSILNRYANKAKLVGYTRLLRRSIRRLSGTEEGEKLIAFYKDELCKLLESVDTLSFD